VPENDASPLDTAAVAALVGVEPNTVRLYLKRTRRRIADGLPVRPSDFPLPDLQVARSPAWYEATVRAWLAERPGRGRRSSD
jgi:predicted DNA-binding transcriptional regulator AlpA